MARLSDADQSRLPLPRLDSRRADRARSGALLRSRGPRRAVRHSGMAVVLLQEPAIRRRPLRRARPLHSADEAQEHVAFFFNDTATTEIYTLSLHDALPTNARTFVILR